MVATQGHDRDRPANRSALPDLGKSIELLGRVKQGDAQALDELLGRYRERLRRIVRLRMSAELRSVLDEEDLVQETFLVAFKKLPEFEVRSHAAILRWLSTIALNQIRDAAEFHHAQKRDLRRRANLPEGSSTSVPAVFVDGGPSPSQMGVRAELEQLVDAAIESLRPEAYREVVMQRDLYGADWEEIRESMGRPSVAAVMELYRRAHARLAELVRKRHSG